MKLDISSIFFYNYPSISQIVIHDSIGGPMRLSGMFKNSFVKNTIFSMGGFGIQVISNFVFNAVLYRIMGSADIGIFISFFYFLLSFSQPNNSLQLAVAKYTSENEKSISEILSDITPTLLILGMILFIIFAGLSPLIKDFMRLSDIRPVIIGGIYIAVSLIMSGFRGAYQGKMRFSVYGMNIGVESVARTMAGILFVLLGWGIAGAVGASVVSGFIAIIILIEGKIQFIFHHLHMHNWRVNKRVFIEFLKACAALLPFGLIIALDLSLIQNLIGGKESGYISACALFGKSLISMSLVFANVVFSYMLKKKENTFWYGIGLTIITFLGAAITTVFIGNWLVHLLFGNDSAEIISLLPIYILASLPLGIMQNIVNYSVAKDSTRIKIIIWIILILMAAGYYFALTHTSVRNFLWIMLGAGLAADFVLLLTVLSVKRKGIPDRV